MEKINDSQERDKLVEEIAEQLVVSYKEYIKKEKENSKLHQRSGLDGE